MDTRQQNNTSVSPDEWYTPKWLIDKLGPFDLDPCSPADRPYDTAAVHVTKEQDGLKYDWGRSRIWLNPPYSQPLLRAFVEKLAEQNNGIALLANRTDNLLFHEVIFPKAASILFLRNRIRFIRPDGTSGNPFFGSCLVAFGRLNDVVLRNCGIDGKFVILNPCQSVMSHDEYILSKERIEKRRELAFLQYTEELSALKREYLDSNRPIPVGSAVKVTTIGRKGETVETIGILTGYELYCDDKPAREDVVHYVVKVTSRTERCYPVDNDRYIVEKIEKTSLTTKE